MKKTRWGRGGKGRTGSACLPRSHVNKRRKGRGADSRSTLKDQTHDECMRSSDPRSVHQAIPCSFQDGEDVMVRRVPNDLV